jgi:hypothetical protein
MAVTTIDLSRLHSGKQKVIVQVSYKSRQTGRFPPAEAMVAIVLVGFYRREGDLGTYSDTGWGWEGIEIEFTVRQGVMCKIIPPNRVNPIYTTSFTSNGPWHLIL